MVNSYGHSFLIAPAFLIDVESESPAEAASFASRKATTRSKMPYLCYEIQANFPVPRGHLSETSFPHGECAKGLRIMNHHLSPSCAHDAFLFPLREMAADRKKTGPGQLR
jgi:hypothetical protein